MGGNVQVDATRDQTPSMSPPPEESRPAMKHSGPGIASFILGLLGILSAIVGLLVIFVTLADYATPNGLNIPDSEELAANAAVAVGALLYLLSLLLSLVGIVLGIVGCVIRNRRRIFAVLGLVFSAIVTVGTVVTLLLGILAQS